MKTLRAAALGMAVAAVAVSGATTSVRAEKRAFALEDLYRVQTPSDVHLSADGRSLLYALRSTDLPRGTANHDLYRLDLFRRDGEPRRLTWTEDTGETEPTPSPDGRWIAFVSKRDEQDTPQIWLLPTDGGEARALTDFPGGASGLVWSPDGAALAFQSEVYPDCGADAACHRERDERREAGRLEAHVADELLYRHWDAWADGKVTHVLVVDVDDGTVRDLTPGAKPAPVFSLGGGVDYAFSPDGSELCYTRNSDPIDAHAWSTNSDLWVVPVAPDADGTTRPARLLTAGNPAWDGAPRYSPDGRHIAFLRQSEPGYESDLVQLAVLDRATGDVRVLTGGFDDWVREFRWRADGSGLVFTAPYHGRTPLYEVPLAGGPVRKIADGFYADDFALAADGMRAYAIVRSVGQPSEIWEVPLAGGSPRRLTWHNRELETEVDVRPAESIWVTASGGRPMQVFIVKPPGFDPARRYPTILNVHGGPQGMWADAFRGDWQVYPGAGYVVAFANPTGSTGYGQALTERISGDWGGRVFDDLMAIADAIEKLPYVDAERFGAMGWSYGGYMMNWFQGHTDRFAALANMMGLFDLRSFYFATEELWFPEWDLGGTPWESDLYERWNPAAFVAQWTTPMLVISGELDFRVPYTQGLMAFTALRRQGVPARLVVLPEAGHWPDWYEMALYYTAHLDWFHRYLGGDPPPWSVEAFARNAVFDPETGERYADAEGAEPEAESATAAGDAPAVPAGPAASTPAAAPVVPAAPEPPSEPEPTREPDAWDEPEDAWTQPAPEAWEEIVPDDWPEEADEDEEDDEP